MGRKAHGKDTHKYDAKQIRYYAFNRPISARKLAELLPDDAIITGMSDDFMFREDRTTVRVYSLTHTTDTPSIIRLD